MAGLYLHVPFCGATCSYCHFARTVGHDAALRRRTVAALIREFELRCASCSALKSGRRTLATAYVGGGTPSLLEPRLMAALIDGTIGRLPKAPDLELTVEANPESFCRKTAEIWLEAGINRVSLGVQSLDEQVLHMLGRRCDPAAARLALAVACGTFQRVAADWILGPGLESARLLGELDEALELGVEHLSLYILDVRRGTPLAAAVAQRRVCLASDRSTERLYLECCDHLSRRGLVHYEVSNFARPGAESRHNRAYWTGVPYLGLGPSASGFYGRRRYTNEADLDRYLSHVESGCLPEAEIDPLDRRARRLERLVLPLRTSAGIPFASLPPGVLDLKKGQSAGLWTLDGGRLHLTRRGWLHLDAIEEKLAAGLAAAAG